MERDSTEHQHYQVWQLEKNKYTLWLFHEVHEKAWGRLLIDVLINSQAKVFLKEATVSSNTHGLAYCRRISRWENSQNSGICG